MSNHRGLRAFEMKNAGGTPHLELKRYLYVKSGGRIIDTVGGSSVGAFSSTSASSNGVTMTRSSMTRAWSVFGYDAGAALYGSGSVPDIRVSLDRFLITGDQTGGHVRLYGNMGQVKAYDGKWNTEQVAGVYGYLELQRSSSTMTLGGYGLSAGLLSCVESTGTMTVNTNHVLGGVSSISKLTSGLTQTGKVVAFYAGIYDVTNWSDSTARSKWGWAFYAPAKAVSAGICIGDFASSYATGSGIAFSSSVTTANRFYAEATADLTSAYNTRVILGRHLVVTASATVNQETYGVTGQLCVKNTTLGHLHAGVTGTFEVNTAATVNNAYAWGTAAVMARLGGGTSILTATTGVAGFSAVFNGEALAAGNSAAYAATKTGTLGWTYGLYFPASSVDVDCRFQSGSTIDDSNHLDIETLDDTKRIRLNDRNYAATSGDIIGFSAKPAANASGTQTVYGGQISPRFNDNIDGATLVGLQVEPILKGATVLALTGDMRGLDVRLTSEGANTVGGIAGGLFLYNELPASTYTGGVYPIVVKPGGKTKQWDYLMEIPAEVTNVANGGGADVYLDITIGGVAARVAAKYVS